MNRSVYRPSEVSELWWNIFISVSTGAKVAQYAGKHLHKYIVNRSEYKEGRIEDALRQVCGIINN
jgi:hypothetical protein